MSAALAYAPRRTALGRASAGAASLYLLAFAIVAFMFANPLVLAACAAAVAIAGVAGGARAALLAALRWGGALALLIVAVNALASQRGETILVRGPELPLLGTVDVTAEALAEGGVLALRIVVVLAVFAVHTACVDPDRLLRMARPLARRSALTATLITRLAPLAAADQQRLRDAAVLRGPAAAPVGRAAMLNRLVAWSLDRAVEFAAALELRGYSAGAPGRATPRRRAPGDAVFALTGLTVLALALGVRLGAGAGFAAYPTVALDVGAGTFLLATALPLAALAPPAVAFLRARRVPKVARGHV